uniref:Tegument serine/threonine protein kinase n=1 Tax=Human herpesvirus 1 TaxID=10298 RepID=A0A0F7GU06_HHV1|nr:tegument serine/threonine protein kinase [Human alphaherpesvirus 1]AKG61072.1 tegument serine/threonine protein kinase [Human alphaherpesvirus 1]AKH80412.1 tegument serine/threonine protein kinase [Human alphaherpesvirus 1]
MDESRRQRPAGHVAANLSPQGARQRSFKDWLASYIHSNPHGASGRPSGPSLQDAAVSRSSHGSRHRSGLRERLRAGLSRWRMSRSSHRRASPETPGTAAKLNRPPLRRSQAALTAPPRPPRTSSPSRASASYAAPCSPSTPPYTTRPSRSPGPEASGGLGDTVTSN